MKVKLAVFMACLWVVMLVVTLIPPPNSNTPPPPTTTTTPFVNNIKRLWALQEALLNAGSTTTIEGDNP